MLNTDRFVRNHIIESMYSLLLKQFIHSSDRSLFSLYTIYEQIIIIIIYIICNRRTFFISLRVLILLNLCLFHLLSLHQFSLVHQRDEWNKKNISNENKIRTILMIENVNKINCITAETEKLCFVNDIVRRRCWWQQQQQQQ